MKKKKTNYWATSKQNPVYLSRKIEKLDEKLQILQNQIAAITRSHDNHIMHLANFARHDIKNAIQNMDSILSTSTPAGLADESLSSLTACLQGIRDTLENFAKLIPYSSTHTFTLDSLLVAVQLLARAEMQKNDIFLEVAYPRESGIAIQLPFQAVLQMMNNLIINATKALEGIESKKLFIQAGLDKGHMNISIRDNGVPIPTENSVRIFEYGFSTTGGSGIGLYHARYLCTAFNGEIEVDLRLDPDYNKTFQIKLPITLPFNGKESTDH